MAAKAWAGVFQEATDSRFERFSESISFDRRLYAQDIACSTAHAQMLAKIGVLSGDECQEIEQALAQIREEIEQGVFRYDIALEDIHMHVERALIEQLGDIGRKLHTGRSRNDQVSTDLRLWIRDAIDTLDQRLAELQRAFVGRARSDDDCVLPGYTHMRRAQPVLAAHHWLAYCEKFDRDRDRMSDCRSRVNVLPLGTAALAGTSLPIDRQDVARRLGFEGVSANSLDSSSDRDFVLEFTFTLVQIALHLSTWAEEWILWSTEEFGFLKLPEAFCSGSSIMPQKVNPDVLELIRGKTARVVGHAQALAVLVKGLPLAYNRDLQEDKPAVFDAFDTVDACLDLAAPVVEGAMLDRERIAAGIERGHLDATALMEYLIRNDIPQRTAHGIVGKLVRKAIDENVTLSELPLAKFQQASPQLDRRVYEILGSRRAVESLTTYGSSGPDMVAQQIDAWEEKIGLTNS